MTGHHDLVEPLPHRAQELVELVEPQAGQQIRHGPPVPGSDSPIIAAFDRHRQGLLMPGPSPGRLRVFRP
jgi:hypothetical protein